MIFRKLIFSSFICTVYILNSCKTSRSKSGSLNSEDSANSANDERVISSTAEIDLAGGPKNIVYYNMDPIDPDAKKGLDYIIGGRALAPLGIPSTVFSTLRKNFNAPNISNDWVRRQNYGLAPSPNQRILGVASNIGDLGLGSTASQVSM